MAVKHFNISLELGLLGVVRNEALFFCLSDEVEEVVGQVLRLLKSEEVSTEGNLVKADQVGILVQ